MLSWVYRPITAILEDQLICNLPRSHFGYSQSPTDNIFKKKIFSTFWYIFSSSRFSIKLFWFLCNEYMHILKVNTRTLFRRQFFLPIFKEKQRKTKQYNSCTWLTQIFRTLDRTHSDSHNLLFVLLRSIFFSYVPHEIIHYSQAFKGNIPFQWLDHTMRT